MRRTLACLHATCGIVLAAYVLIAATSGGALIFKAEILAAAHPALTQAEPPPDIIAQAQRLERTIDGPISSIRFPDDTLNAFTARFADGSTALYDPETLTRQGDHLGLIAASDWLFDLHHHLLAGETGETISGICGLLLLAMIVSGAVLWWPRRKAWRLRHIWPGRSSRTQRLAAHQTLAVALVPLLSLAALTGSAMIFYDEANGILAAVLGDGDGTVAPVAGAGPMAALASRQFGEAAPRLLVPPGEGDDVLTIRLRQPGEAHPNGRTSLAWDASRMRLTAAHDPLRAGMGNRAADLLYPLHIGSIGGLALRLLLLGTAAASVLATSFAVGAYLKRGGKRRRTRPGRGRRRAEA